MANMKGATPAKETVPSSKFIRHPNLLQAMPGLMLLQPGGNLLEILVGFVAAYVGAYLVISLKFFDARVPAQSPRPAA